MWFHSSIQNILANPYSFFSRESLSPSFIRLSTNLSRFCCILVPVPPLVVRRAGRNRAGHALFYNRDSILFLHKKELTWKLAMSVKPKYSWKSKDS